MTRPLTVEKHDRIHSAILQAERLAAYTLTTIRGRTAEAVALEVASRVINSLTSKTSDPSRP
jgi:hypothetical protein